MNDPTQISTYQLRAVLNGVSPLIWRRLLLSSATTLADLHWPSVGVISICTSFVKDKEMNGEGFYIRDGIVVIPKNSVIASNTRI
jgi:hypothetical protein